MDQLSELIKSAEKLVKALKEVQKPTSLEFSELTSIEKAVSALGAYRHADVGALLDIRKDEVKKAIAAKIELRRQDLESAARGGALTFRRFDTYDRLLPFKVEYRKTSVSVFVGSEELFKTEEIDGRVLYKRICEEYEQLIQGCLPRDRFLHAITVAFGAAKADGRVADGKVKVRDLFPYFVMARQLASDTFKKKPTAKNFSEFSLAAFAFELYKFGDHTDGWTFGDRRLCNLGPNMATQHEALVLPDAGGNPTQILWLWMV